MKKMYVLSDYKLTYDQIKDAQMSLGIDEFVYPPEEINKCWKTIPPDASIIDLRQHLQPVKDWLENAITGDVVLIPSDIDIGGVFHLVPWLKDRKEVRCVYATARYHSVDTIQPDGSVKKQMTLFEHVMFRPIIVG